MSKKSNLNQQERDIAADALRREAEAMFAHAAALEAEALCAETEANVIRLPTKTPKNSFSA